MSKQGKLVCNRFELQGDHLFFDLPQTGFGYGSLILLNKS